MSVAEILNSLEMVRWDRFTENGGYLYAYGWIELEPPIFEVDVVNGAGEITQSIRQAGRADFVLVMIERKVGGAVYAGRRSSSPSENARAVWATTSSAKYSAQIMEILELATPEEHIECERIEQRFPGVTNAIKLEG